MEPRSPELQADSFPSEPPEKPKCMYSNITILSVCIVILIYNKINVRWIINLNVKLEQ